MNGVGQCDGYTSITQQAHEPAVFRNIMFLCFFCRRRLKYRLALFVQNGVKFFYLIGAVTVLGLLYFFLAKFGQN